MSCYLPPTTYHLLLLVFVVYSLNTGGVQKDGHCGARGLGGSAEDSNENPDIPACGDIRRRYLERGVFDLKPRYFFFSILFQSFHGINRSLTRREAVFHGKVLEREFAN